MDQNDSHDWFGALAETYVGYLAAREGFEVFGAGKWTADVAIHEKDSRRLFRVEVRSTDQSRKPRPKPASKLAGVAEVVAEVTIRGDSLLRATFWKLDDRGHKLPLTRLEAPAAGELRPWLLAGPIASPASERLSADTDPVLALSGAFTSERADIGERHDDHLGRALAAEARGPSDG